MKSLHKFLTENNCTENEIEKILTYLIAIRITKDYLWYKAVANNKSILFLLGGSK